MRRLATALKKLDTPATAQGSPPAEPQTAPRFRVDGVRPEIAAPHFAWNTEQADDTRLNPLRRFDSAQSIQHPHIDRSPVLLPPLASRPEDDRALLDDGENLDPAVPGMQTVSRFRHQYQQIVAQLRDRGPSCRSSIVALFGVSESNSTAELVRDLGECLVQQGEGPVLLVDGNFWDRRLSRLWRLEHANGFSDVLAGWPWRTVAIAGSDPQLTLIPAGSGFVQRMDGHSWGSLMDEWRDLFRWILLDGGPSAAWLAEGLCTSCDQVVLHSGLDQTSSPELRTAVKRIRRLGGRLIGSIFTSPDWRQTAP